MKVIKESKTPTEVLATFRLFNNDYEVKGYRQHNPTNNKEIVEIYENGNDYVGKGIETWYNRPSQRFTFANALVKAVVHVFGIQADELIEECVETSRDCQEAMDKFVEGWDKGSVTESKEEDNEKMTCPKCKNNTYQEIEHNSITGQRNFRCASCGYTKSTPEDEEPTNEGLSVKHDIEFIMNDYVKGTRGVTDFSGKGTTYKFKYNSNPVTIIFDPSWDEWVYTINGQGPYSHSSYEYIFSDIEKAIGQSKNEAISTVKKPYKVTLKVNSAVYSSFIVKANNEEEAREIAETKSDGKEIIAVKEISDNEVASLKDRGMSVVESVIKEDWVQIEFTSGSNPYIAKTEQELARLQKKYGNKMSKQDDTHYIVDDKETNTFTEGANSEEYIGPISFENGEVLYIVKDGNKLYAGSATNSGVFHDYEMDYDDTFSRDVNLQNFYDKICEENPDLCSDGGTNESLKESTSSELAMEDIMNLCIKNDWYSHGDVASYEGMLTKASKGEMSKEDIAQDIYEHSANGTDYDKVLDELNKLSSLKESKDLSTTNVTKKLKESVGSKLNDLPKDTTKIKW